MQGRRSPFGRMLRAIAWMGCAALGSVGATGTKVPDTMAQRMQACTACHGKEGVSTNQGYSPRIAGKPPDYLYRQMLNFQSGRRTHEAMAHLLALMPERYLREIANYFGNLDLPYPAPQPDAAPQTLLEQGEKLVLQGDKLREIPACVSCHGAAMTGRLPSTPGLLGLPRDYVVAQLGAWKTGVRQNHAPDCMAEVARHLSPGNILAVSTWLSARPVPANGHPAPADKQGPPAACKASTSPSATSALMAKAPSTEAQRGAYLARLGNCASCHTEPGGTPYAGGRAIETPFGNVYAGNLTPSPAGLAGWNAEDFWGAMHHGQSRNGLLLYPAFPYPEFSRITREDSDALFAFLRTLSAVDKRNREHTLRFPFNTQAALRAWRWAYFTPQTQTLHPEKSVAWNRGSYLVEGLGHCATCHSPRNVLGGIPSGEQFKGGVLPAQKWLAPSLLSPDQAGVAHWPLAEVKSLLKNGVSAQAVVTGPMAEVVYGSTQFASDEDMTAIATYLRELPQSAPQAQPRMPSKTASTQRGAKLYEKQCAACHADNGEGAPGAYPALAGNRAVKQDNPTNLIRTLVRGGFAPATQGNPRPYGMPPFGHSLSNRDIADVLTFIRQHWENDALEVSELDVLQAR